jgi:dTDP-4-dehydrorhamnose 3,5-epimerase
VDKNLECKELAIPDVKLLTPKKFGDQRGFFIETFSAAKYGEYGIPNHFVQDNMSFSRKGTLRGLHYQLKYPQAKLVSVVQGIVLDVAVDIRVGSPWFGQSVSALLSDANHCQLYVPEGFAHGFCVLSDTAMFTYKCSDFYHPEDDAGVFWSDPALGIDWGDIEPILSDKDKSSYLPLSEIEEKLLPCYKN